MSGPLGLFGSRLTALLQARDPGVRRVARLALHHISSADTDAVTAWGFVVVEPERGVRATAPADDAVPGHLPVDECARYVQAFADYGAER